MMKIEMLIGGEYKCLLSYRQVFRVEILKRLFAPEEVAIFQPQDCQCHRNRVLFGSLISVGGGRKEVGMSFSLLTNRV